MADKNFKIDIQTTIKTAESAKTISDLRNSLRQLQSAMLEIGDTSSESFQELQVAAGNVRDRMGDIREQVNGLSGDPLENINNNVTQIGSSLSNLNFGGVTNGIQSMTKNIQNMNAGGFTKQIGEMSSAFIKLGAAVLSNPFTLLVGSIILLIMNFEKLAKVGGIIGDTFSVIGKALSKTLDFFYQLTDALGLTNIKGQELEETLRGMAEAQLKFRDAVIDSEASINKSKGLSTVYLEYEKLKNAIESARLAYTRLLDQKVKADKEFFLPVLDSKTKKEADDMLDALYKQIEIPQDVRDEIKNSVGLFYEQIIKKDEFLAVNQITLQKELNENLKDNQQARINAMRDGQAKEFAQNELNRKKELEAAQNQNKLLISTQQDLNKAMVEEKRRAADESIGKLRETLKDQNDEYDKSTKDLNDRFRKAQEDLRRDEEILAAMTSGPKIIGEYKSLKRAQEEAVRVSREKISTLMQEAERIGVYYKSRIGVTEAYIKSSEDAAQAEIDVLQKTTVLENDLREKQSAINEKYNRLNYETAQKWRKKNYDETLSTLQKEYGLIIGNQEEIFIQRSENLNKQEVIINKFYDNEVRKAAGNRNLIKQIEVDRAKNLQDLTTARIETEKSYHDYILGLIEERRKAEEEASKSMKAIDDQREKSFQNIQANRKNELADIITMRQAEISAMETLEQKRAEITGLRHLGTLQAEKSLIDQLLFAQKEANQQRMEDELSALELTEQQKQLIRDKYAKTNEDLDIKAAAKKRKMNEESIKAAAALAQQGADLIMSINDIADGIQDAKRDANGRLDLIEQKKRFERTKKAQLAAAIINTAAGVTSALATQNYPGAAVIAASGAAQILKIRNTQFKADSGTGDGTGTDKLATAPAQAPDMATPNPFYGQGYLNKNPNYPGQGPYGWKGGQDIRFYVLESDISSTMMKAQVRENRSTLRGF